MLGIYINISVYHITSTTQYTCLNTHVWKTYAHVHKHRNTETHTHTHTHTICMHTLTELLTLWTEGVRKSASPLTVSMDTGFTSLCEVWETAKP